MKVLSNSITKDFTKHKEDIDLFNENLKKIRKERGYTQEELAAKVGVVRQTVSKWEKGLSVPDTDILCKIAEVLDTNINILLGDEIATDVDDLNQLNSNEKKNNNDNNVNVTTSKSISNQESTVTIETETEEETN